MTVRHAVRKQILFMLEILCPFRKRGHDVENARVLDDHRFDDQTVGVFSRRHSQFFQSAVRHDKQKTPRTTGIFINAVEILRDEIGKILDAVEPDALNFF